jgi:hypothetical protein
MSENVSVIYVMSEITSSYILVHVFWACGECPPTVVYGHYGGKPKTTRHAANFRASDMARIMKITLFSPAVEYKGGRTDTTLGPSSKTAVASPPGPGEPS